MPFAGTLDHRPFRSGVITRWERGLTELMAEMEVEVEVEVVYVSGVIVIARKEVDECRREVVSKAIGPWTFLRFEYVEGNIYYRCKRKRKWREKDEEIRNNKMKRLERKQTLYRRVE